MSKRLKIIGFTPLMLAAYNPRYHDDLRIFDLDKLTKVQFAWG